MISASDRQAAVVLIEEAVACGASKRLACREIGITLRTLRRFVRGVVRTIADAFFIALCRINDPTRRSTPRNEDISSLISAGERRLID